MTPAQHRTEAENRLTQQVERHPHFDTAEQRDATLAHAHLAGAAGTGSSYIAAEAALDRVSSGPVHQRGTNARQALVLAVLATR